MGTETGLFEVMSTMDTPKTSQEIADAGNLKERYVREWLGAMVLAHIVNYDPTTKTYLLPKHRHIIAGTASIWSLFLPVLSKAFFGVAECFKKDGPPGLSYDAYPNFDYLMAKAHGPLFQKDLINRLMHSLPEPLKNKLESGIKMVDIGCGHGISTVILAEHFPKSKIIGLDLSEEGVKAAQAKAEAAGVTNATFVCARRVRLTPDWTAEFDYAFTHLVIHDLPDPLRALQEIHRVLIPGGTLSVMEAKLGSNLEDNFMYDYGTSYYAISMMHCVPTSLRTGEGAGLGVAFGKKRPRFFYKKLAIMLQT